MVNMSIDTDFLNDGRVDYLAALLNQDRFSAEGRLLRTWAHCYKHKTSIIKKSMVNAIAQNKTYADCLVESHLAEDIGNDEIKVKGASDRIQYLVNFSKKQSDKAKISVQKRLEKSGSVDNKSSHGSATAQPRLSHGSAYLNLNLNSNLNSNISDITSSLDNNLNNSVLDRRVVSLATDPPAADGQVQEKPKAVQKHVAMMDSWNQVCGPLPKVKELSRDRCKKLAARLNEKPELEYWRGVFAAMASSKFLTGDNDRKWRASFDWIITNDTNHLKVLEGKYDEAERQTYQWGYKKGL